MIIKSAIEKITAKKSLALAEARELMLLIMSGELTNAQIASLITALKIKGESAEEVAGFVQAMRLNSKRVEYQNERMIDMCGTGGDGSGTFNVSTVASFVVAGAGYKVAKHGNRSISSKCGSSDLLSELGVNINLTAEESQKVLDEIGITFLFAPLYHPAMRHAAPVRAELGFKTIFNILGPLTNPASTKNQLIGTYSYGAAKLMAEAARHLDMQKICFVCTDNRYDEISLSSPTSVVEFNNGSKAKEYHVDYSSFGFPKCDESKLLGETPKENAAIALRVLEAKLKDDAYYVTCANAAMGLYTAGYSTDLRECAAAAEESVCSGSALKKLNELKNFN